MAEYSLFTDTPQLTANADSSVSLGTAFNLNAEASLIGMRYLQPTNGSTSQRTMALYNGAGLMVAGPFTMPTPTPGSWCVYTLDTPAILSAGDYKAVTFHPTGDYAATGGYFAEGGPAADDIIIGPLTLYGTAHYPNGTYGYGGSISYPDGSFNGGNYWSDIIVSDGDEPTGNDYSDIAALFMDGVLTAVGVAALPQNENGNASLSSSGVLSISAAPAVASEALFESVGILTVEGIPGELNSATVHLSAAGVLAVAGVASINAAGAVALGTVGALSINGVDDTQREYGELSLGSEGALSVVGSPRFTGIMQTHGAGDLAVAIDSITTAGVIALAAVGTLKAQNMATRRDITVTARLAPRRWSTRLNETHRWAAHL